jgi:predicted O-methyltransferase YrrM
MSNQTLSVTPALYDYILSVSLREHPLLAQLRAETLQMEWAIMQISPEQGQFMQLITKLTHAKRCVEVGVFTGYSSLAVALALPDDGRITACDVSEEWTNVARRYWNEAGVAHKIDLHLAPAADTLQGLLEKGEAGSYDLAFVDADKTSYDEYYELCLRLLRPGGLMLIDNTLYSGEVADPAADSPQVLAIRALNKKIYTDDRVDLTLLPLSDGVTMVRKR